MTEQEYEAYVYDLDGTLVELDVDWGTVREEVAAVLRARGLDVEGMDLWTLLGVADETGYRRPVERKIAEHERDGARVAERMALVDGLPHEVPVGVCSLNCEAACRIALEQYGVDSHVDVVVGRDSCETEKPDPEPLLAAVDALGARPDRTLFIGDSPRDRETADAAGTAFVTAAEWNERD